MSAGRVERRLAAILAADVAGYSRLMEGDEEGTLAALRAIRDELVDPKIAEHRGCIVKTTGDGLLVEFASVVDAVRCAVEVQRAMAECNAGVPADKRIELRIGIHQGDVIVEDGDIFGDGVNLAARLESLADPGGICVSGRVHADVAGKLDVGFEDLGEQQVKNISRPVRVFRAQFGTPKAAAGSEPALALPDKPSIAVLPFANMSGDPEQEYFADGMVEEITTAIARLPWLFVIARNSSFTYKGRAVDVKQVARELGVRYVLEGSVRKAGNRVRITGQLIDTTTGAHIWADRFDGALDDIFDLQDRVASNVVGAIEPKLQKSEIERVARKPAASLGAYDLYLRALEQYHKYTEEGFGEAVDLLERALIIDPSCAPAAALIGWCRVFQREGWQLVTDAEANEALRPQTRDRGRQGRPRRPMDGWPRYLSARRRCSRRGERLRSSRDAQPKFRACLDGTRIRIVLSKPPGPGDRGLRAGNAAEPARSPGPSFYLRNGLRPYGCGAIRGDPGMGGPLVARAPALPLFDVYEGDPLRPPRPARGSA